MKAPAAAIRAFGFIVPPLAISLYLFYPILSGTYIYHNSEQGPYLSFMVNFIDSLRNCALPVWNQYVGGGHPAMYFAHYPISQNTLIYILFGFNDFTYYFTKFMSTVTIMVTFVLAARLFKLDYLTAMLGALIYFSINFVVRIVVAETIANLIVLYPALVMLSVYIVKQVSARIPWREVLVFILCYVFWLLGNNLTYVHIHAVMLTVVYWLAVLVYRGGEDGFSHVKKHALIYLLIFVAPWIAVLYQYYFVLDVVAASNRLKEGLIVGFFDPTVWKQLSVSFVSSSYVWMGLFGLLTALLVKGFLGKRFFSDLSHRFRLETWKTVYVAAIVALLIVTLTGLRFKVGSFLLSDYVPLFNSTVFRVSLLIYLSMQAFLGTRGKTALVPTGRDALIFLLYISLLSYYFYSPDNINESGPGKGYDYALFKEVSVFTQVIFTTSILFAIGDYDTNRLVKTMILSLVVLYLLRSHFAIPILRFTGIIWYSTRDGSIFSALFAVIFMFGLKTLGERFLTVLNISPRFSRLGGQSGFLHYAKYGVLIFLVLLVTADSYDKLYKGTSHRFVYPSDPSMVRSPEEIRISDARTEIRALNAKLIDLHQRSRHFYRLFTPENNVYLAGTLQDHKIFESVIYDSAISRQFQEFYDSVILERPLRASKELRYAMPYHLFTSHFHRGIGLKHSDISYRDFFVFSPQDAATIGNGNIEFFWDLMQVQYLVIGQRFSEAITGLADGKHAYSLLGYFPTLDLSLFEIEKKREHGRFAFLPLDQDQSYRDVVDKMNSPDIETLRSFYSRLVFPAEDVSDFKVRSVQYGGSFRRYDLETKKEAMLVEFESWNHNWRLHTPNPGGERVDKVFHILRGVRLHKGLNRIELSYDLRGFTALFLVSLVSISLLVVLITVSCCSKRRREDR